jgi:hypothetical protein
VSSSLTFGKQLHDTALTFLLEDTEAAARHLSVTGELRPDERLSIAAGTGARYEWRRTGLAEADESA